jgi:hypothetical protein
MTKGNLVFGITKERKLLRKSFKPLRNYAADICVNVSGAELTGDIRDIARTCKKTGFKGLVNAKNGFLNISINEDFLKRIVAEKAKEEGLFSCGESFAEQYAVVRIKSLLDTAKENEFFFPPMIYDDIAKTIALIICEDELFCYIKPLVDVICSVFGNVSPAFSYTQEAEKTVAELFIESDRRRLIFNEIDIDLYKAVLNFLQKRDKGAAIDE